MMMENREEARLVMVENQEEACCAKCNGGQLRRSKLSDGGGSRENKI